jgi:cellobiose phosphorylase
MEPQCWALISETADKVRAHALINSCDEILDTEVGYLLLAPTFREIDENIGRISSMEPGIAENGTVYSHLNVWMILGLLKYGMADKAYEVFKKITPGYINGYNDSKHRTPPYIYANCYFGPDHKNNKFQMEFTWITGSVAWFNHVLLDYMIGARAEFDGLKIDPCIPSEWEECSVVRNYRGSVYNIKIKNPNKVQKGNVELVLDGKKIEGNVIPVFNDGEKHMVEAIIKKQ